MNSKLIDPQLDKIPADPITEEERESRIHSAPRPGLSINETIAHDANHSIGSVGVDTSSVEAGPDLDENLSETAPATPRDPLDPRK